MMRVEDKSLFADTSQTRHGVRKKRKGRSYHATRRAIDRAGARGGVAPAQPHGVRRHGSAVDGEACGGGSAQTGATQGTCGGRVLRSRRYRRPFEDKPIKRLFTPEIKRFLKGWLVRRRENPYPSREEKKELSRQTALTYVQICNWFANWRRKLKNAADEADQPDGGSADLMEDNPDDDLEDSAPEDGSADDGGEEDEAPERGRGRTWGNLIRSYNSRAQGNVEQFSITSDDSIWEEAEESVDVVEEDFGDHHQRGGGGGHRSRREGAAAAGARPRVGGNESLRAAASSSSGEEDEGEANGCQEDWPTVEHSYSILLDRPKGAARQQQHRLHRTSSRKPGDREAGRRAFGQRQGYTGARKGSCEVTSSSSSSSSSASDSEGDGARVPRSARVSGSARALGAAGGGRGRVAFVVARGGDQKTRVPPSSSQVTKWLESTYAFDERKMNFSSVVDAGGTTSVQLKWAARNVTWPTGDSRSAAERTSWILSRVGQEDTCRWSVAGRHKEELDAAEALARLSTTASP